MNNHRIRTLMYLRIITDGVLIMVLLLAAWAGGMNRLHDWQGPAGTLSNDLFIPAIMMNAGKGFVSADPHDIPGMRAFLDFQAPDFKLSSITSETTLLPADPYQSFHRYLIYSVALAWRLGDISWDSIKALLVVFLCASVMLVFLISRTVMHPVLSFLVALGFVYAAPVLMTLHILRDFAKAPFILAVFLLLLILAQCRLSRRQYLLVAMLGGLALGIGMGFRREMVIFLPISLFLVTVSSLRTPFINSIPSRLFATLLLLACFFFSAWPIHRALAAHGYVAAHDTIMGFSSDSDHEIELLVAPSYEKHYLYNDLYATLKAHDAAMRGISRITPYDQYDDLEIKQDYVKTLFKTFPADVLIRAYASVLRLVSGVFPTRNPYFGVIEPFGLWFMIVALVILAAKSPGQAWLVLLLTCWFCGYTSLQFGLRHVFHMTFVPYFFAGYAVQLLGNALFAVARSKQLPGLRTVRPALCAGVWVALTLCAFGAPLVVARIVQHTQVNRMMNAYANAEALPLSHQLRLWEGKQILSPDLSALCRPCDPQFSIDALQHRVLIARFTGLTEPIDLFLLYEWEKLPWDFSGRLSLQWLADQQPTHVDYYIPIHEARACGSSSVFLGVLVEENILPHFQGFYELTDLTQVPLLTAMAIPEDPNRFVSWQRLTVPWRGQPWHAGYRPYFLFDLEDPNNGIAAIHAAIHSGEEEQALLTARSLLATRPGSVQLALALCEVLLHLGHAEEFSSVVDDLVAQHPDNFMLFSRLYAWWERYSDDEPLLSLWTGLEEQFPDNCLIENYLERINTSRLQNQSFPS